MRHRATRHWWTWGLWGVGAVLLAIGSVASDTAAAQSGPAYTQRHWTTEEGLLINSVRDLVQGPQGYLWMTSYGGLIRFDGAEFTAMRTASSALPTNRLGALRVGPDDNLWVRTKADQLVRVDPRYHRVTGVYGDGAGGFADRLNTMATDAKGRLWVGTGNMLYLWVAADSTWRPTPSPPPAAIEAVSVADTSYRGRNGASLRLRPSECSFTVRYTGLHLASPAATQFRTVLKGFDRRPTRTDERSVRYTNVDPGTYTFVVRAAGERGAFGAPARLTVTVAPFWWETSWFYGLCVLGALGLAVSRSTLYHRLKEQVGLTPSQFVRQVRVEHAARLLRENEGTISEVAYAVGFSRLSYFSRQFYDRVGQRPSDYVEAAD